MGVPPMLGRVFTPEEERRKDRVVVLSHGLWITQFGASGDVIGKVLQIDGFGFQVIGVMRRHSNFLPETSSSGRPLRRIATGEILPSRPLTTLATQAGSTKGGRQLAV